MGRPYLNHKQDVWQGTLALMVLRTLETQRPMRGYGIARRIEQVSGDRLLLNYGTLYPALLKLEQEGYIESEWGASEHNRKRERISRSTAASRQSGRTAYYQCAYGDARLFRGHADSLEAGTAVSRCGQHAGFTIPVHCEPGVGG